MTRSAALVLIALCLALAAHGVAPGDPQSKQDTLEVLAAEGRIQEDAAVKASAEITIHASPEKVWQILTGVNDWPRWQTTVSAAHLDGALQPGTTFRWKTGNTEIRSRIALVRTNQQIGWTGTAFHARAVHIWSLQPLPGGGGTLVKTTESMDGFLLSAFYSSRDLAKSHEAWLQALKKRAEQ